MAPNASAKIARDAATTRLRIREMRAARARSFARASSFGDRAGSGEGGGGEGGGWGVAATLGAAVRAARADPGSFPGRRQLRVKRRAGREVSGPRVLRRRERG